MHKKQFCDQLKQQYEIYQQSKNKSTDSTQHLDEFIRYSNSLAEISHQIGKGMKHFGHCIKHQIDEFLRSFQS